MLADRTKRTDRCGGLRTMKWRLAILAVGVILMVILLAIGFTVRDRSPLGVGSTPDEAWTYVHTSAAWGGGVPNIFGVRQTHKWTADGGNIYRETEFWWKSGPPFATRKTIFHYGTNDTIRRVSATWKYQWPSTKKAAPAVSGQWGSASRGLAAAGAGMSMHSFHPNRKVFEANLARLKGSNTNQDSSEFLQWYFQKQGVELNPPAMVLYGDRSGELAVFATATNQSKIQKILLDLTSPQSLSKTERP